MAQYSVDIVAKALGGSQVDQLANSFKNVDQAAAKAQGSLDRAANNIRNFGSSAKGAGDAAQALGNSLNGVVGRFAAFAAQLGVTVGAVALFKSSLDAAFAREAAENRLQSLTDSAHEYELAMGAAEIASKRFGTTQTEAANALGDIYGRLKGLGLSLGEVNEIYTGFNVIAREARVSTEDAAGAFLQLSQAMGSGKLQGDELKLILERMPQLAQAIADGMDVGAGAIRQLASDGKIGLTEIQNALAGAATRADELGGTFTNQQATIAQVKQRWEELQVQIGQTLAPAYLTAIEGISQAVFFMGESLKGASAWAQKNADAIKNIVMVGLEIGKIVGSVWLVVAAYQAWQKVTVALAAAKAFLVGLTGKGLVLVAAGAAAAAGAYALLSKGVSDTANEIQRMQGESEKAFQDRKAQVETELKAQAALAKGMQKQEQSAKDLEKAQKGITEAIKESTAEIDKFSQAQTTSVDQALSLTQARLQAEMAVNDVLLQQAERQLAAAQTQDQRVRAAQAVYQLTVRQAQLELVSTRATIAAELEKARIAVEAARMKEREVYAVVQLAIAQKSVTAAHFEALNAQRQAVGLAEQQLRVATQVAAEQNRAAEATYRGKVAAADAAYQQNVVAKNTQAAASAAGQFASNMSSGADAAERAAGALVRAAQGAQGVAPALAQFGEAGKNSEFANAWYEAMKGLNERTLTAAASQRKYNELMAEFLKMAERYNQIKAQEKRSSARDEWSKVTGGIPGFASGGYVNRPTLAMVGEGGEPEYVIPRSRMASAMANFAAGKRGSAVLSSPQVNITTGPVTQMDGTNYVTQGDLMASTQSAVQQTLALLQNNPSVRRSIGVAR